MSTRLERPRLAGVLVGCIAAVGGPDGVSSLTTRDESGSSGVRSTKARGVGAGAPLPRRAVIWILEGETLRRELASSAVTNGDVGSTTMS